MFSGKRDEFDPMRPRLTRGDEALSAPGPSDADLFDMSEVIPDDLVDAMLDGEVANNNIAAARAAIRKDSEAERRFNKTNQILDLLRHTKNAAHAPDLTVAIMSRVERERSLLSWRGLRRVSHLRLSAAALLALVIGAAFFAERHAPQVLSLSDRPAPVNDLVSAVPVQTAGVLATVENAVSAAGRIVPDQFEQARVRDAALMAHQSRAPVFDYVSQMNPPAAMVLWIDPTSAKPGGVSVRLCDGLPCPAARRPIVPAQQVSLRAILAGDERSGATQDTLVAFRR